MGGKKAEKELLKKIKQEGVNNRQAIIYQYRNAKSPEDVVVLLDEVDVIKDANSLAKLLLSPKH